MKSNIVQFVFSVMILVISAGMEELLPKFYGVGFPLLILMSLVIARHCQSFIFSVIFVVMFGAMEDAISTLPIMTSTSFLLIILVFAKWSRFWDAMLLLAYPLYQIWLAIWVSELGAGVFGRLIVSMPIGLIVAIVSEVIVAWCDREVVLHERE